MSKIMVTIAITTAEDDDWADAAEDVREMLSGTVIQLVERGWQASVSLAMPPPTVITTTDPAVVQAVLSGLRLLGCMHTVSCTGLAQCRSLGRLP